MKAGEPERAEAYEKLDRALFAVYVELFPNYVWTDPQWAVTIMAQEIRALRGKVVGAWRQ